MELLTYETKDMEFTYYISAGGLWVRHGECKYYNSSGQIIERSFRHRGIFHGEFKSWKSDGSILDHSFYIDRIRHPFIEMNEQEKLLFQIKHPGFRFFSD